MAAKNSCDALRRLSILTPVAARSLRNSSGGDGTASVLTHGARDRSRANAFRLCVPLAARPPVRKRLCLATSTPSLADEPPVAPSFMMREINTAFDSLTALRARVFMSSASAVQLHEQLRRFWSRIRSMPCGSVDGMLTAARWLARLPLYSRPTKACNYVGDWTACCSAGVYPKAAGA